MHVCLISSSWVYTLSNYPYCCYMCFRKKSFIRSLNNSVEAIGQTDYTEFCLFTVVVFFCKPELITVPYVAVAGIHGGSRNVH